MARNGYSGLQEGPQSGWLGYYSLDKQGRMDDVNLEELIAANADDGLVWTDPTVRCYIYKVWNHVMLVSFYLHRLTRLCADTWATRPDRAASPSPTASRTCCRGASALVWGWDLLLFHN